MGLAEGRCTERWGRCFPSSEPRHRGRGHQPPPPMSSPSCEALSPLTSLRAGRHQKEAFWFGYPRVPDPPDPASTLSCLIKTLPTLYPYQRGGGGWSVEAEAGRKDGWSPHRRVALMKAELRFGLPPRGGRSGRRGKLEGGLSQGLGPCAPRHLLQDLPAGGSLCGDCAEAGAPPTLMRQPGVGRLRPVGTPTPTPE